MEGSNFVNIVNSKHSVNKLCAFNTEQMRVFKSINSISDFPLAFSDFKTHQQSDNEIQEIINSVKSDNNRCVFI